MAQESGQPSESYTSMLWGSRSWEDIYKVQKNSLETKDDADKD